MKHSQASKRMVEVEKKAADALVAAARLIELPPEKLLQLCVVEKIFNKPPPALCDRSENKTSS